MPDLIRAGPYVWYGLVAGALVAAPIAAALVGGVQVSPWLALTLLPLTLSMGVAECELIRHQVVTTTVLSQTVDLATFGRRAVASLALAVARYAAALATLTVACVAIGRVFGGEVPTGTLPLLAGYLALGTALFIGLVLIASGRVGLVGLALAVAACGFVLLREGAALAIDTAFGLICLAAVAALAVVAARDTRRLVTHR